MTLYMILCGIFLVLGGYLLASSADDGSQAVQAHIGVFMALLALVGLMIGHIRIVF